MAQEIDLCRRLSAIVMLAYYVPKLVVEFSRDKSSRGEKRVSSLELSMNEASTRGFAGMEFAKEVGRI